MCPALEASRKTEGCLFASGLLSENSNGFKEVSDFLDPCRRNTVGVHARVFLPTGLG